MPASKNKAETTGSTVRRVAGAAKLKVNLDRAPRSSVELTKADLEFYRAELRQRLHKEMRRVFARLNKEEGLSFAEIARRLGVNRSVITRRFKGQSNITLDVLSDMFRAMGARPSIKAELYKDLNAGCLSWSDIAQINPDSLVDMFGELKRFLGKPFRAEEKAMPYMFFFSPVHQREEADVTTKTVTVKLSGGFKAATRVRSPAEDVRQINLLDDQRFEGSSPVPIQSPVSTSIN